MKVFLTISSVGCEVPAGRIAVEHFPYLVGRAEDADFEFRLDPGLSRRHFHLLEKQHKLVLVDLQSRNGTFVNGVKQSPGVERVLRHGDIIQARNFEFRVEIEDENGTVRLPEH